MPGKLWEHIEHGDRCKRGIHLEYRVRKPFWVEVRCKLCYYKNIELLETVMGEEAA